jgi:hypothetical protein
MVVAVLLGLWVDNVDKDGKDIPLYGRASNIVLGSVRNESHTINYVL